MRKISAIALVMIYFFSLLFLIIFIIVPENKYEWMLGEHSSVGAYGNLPIDPDTNIRMAIFSAPVILLAVLNLVFGFVLFKFKGRIFSLGYSIILVFLVIAKLFF